MKEYRIRSSKGTWPEVFSEDQLYYLKSDLAYNMEQYPDVEFWVEARDVGEWKVDHSTV